MADDKITDAMVDAAFRELNPGTTAEDIAHPLNAYAVKRQRTLIRKALLAAEQAAWRPIEECPVNTSVEIWLPDWDHYGPGIYRAILVDMGTGRHWHTTAWACGRDLDPTYWPKLFRPLPASPASPASPVPCVSDEASETGESEG